MFVGMVNVVLHGVWALYRINKDEGEESLPLLAFRRDVDNAIFLKYSKEGRLSWSHEGIRNTPSNVVKNKAGVGCAKRTLDALTLNVNLRDICFEIIKWY